MRGVVAWCQINVHLCGFSFRPFDVLESATEEQPRSKSKSNVNYAAFEFPFHMIVCNRREPWLLFRQSDAHLGSGSGLEEMLRSGDVLSDHRGLRVWQRAREN